MTKQRGNGWRATAYNEHIDEIAAVAPQKRQCEFGSLYPKK